MHVVPSFCYNQIRSTILVLPLQHFLLMSDFAICYRFVSCPNDDHPYKFYFDMNCYNGSRNIAREARIELEGFHGVLLGY